MQAIHSSPTGCYLLVAFRGVYAIYGVQLDPTVALQAALKALPLCNALKCLPALVQIIRGSPAGSRVRVAVDGVAYAPHQAMDVAAWGVDWYGFR